MTIYMFEPGEVVEIATKGVPFAVNLDTVEYLVTVDHERGIIKGGWNESHWAKMREVGAVCLVSFISDQYVYLNKAGSERFIAALTGRT